MTFPNRRSSDNRVGEIESLISEENDPKQRAFLIILNSINASMMANTSATSQVAEKLDSHMSLFEKKAEADAKLLNQGRGAWRVLAWVLGTAQAVILGIASYVFADIQQVHTELNQIALTAAKTDARLGLLERIK